MKATRKKKLVTTLALAGLVFGCGSAMADDETTNLVDWFKQGTVGGQLKTYYFSQNFDSEGRENSQLWANGGNLGYKTAKYYGFKLGATFQASFVSYKDDPDALTAGSMDASGTVLSEAYLKYNLYKTGAKLYRQYLKYPLIAGSGSRMIKESFESYLITNKNIPDTIITAAYVTKYQTRTDKSNYADNWFVQYEENGTGTPGDFYDIGKDGAYFIYLKNSSVKGLDIQGQYLDVPNEVSSFYADAKYTFNNDYKPYLAAQYYYTSYDANELDSNSLMGLKAGVKVSDFDIFGGYTTVGGVEGDARVFRGIGQGSYFQYTDTTKTAGVAAFEADTNSYQLGVGYAYQKDLKAKFRYTQFDNPAVNNDLDEYTLNFLYTFGDWAEGLSVSVDFSILDYENDQKDATDLRSRLIWSF
jgi:hypothetical protein